jgi:hypothetical protein
VLGSAAERATMAEAGRGRVERMFDISRTAAAYEDLYARLVATRRVGRRLPAP